MQKRAAHNGRPFPLRANLAQACFLDSFRRPAMAAAAAPNRSSIGGAGTSWPPLEPPLVPPEVDEDVEELDELEELVLDDVDEPPVLLDPPLLDEEELDEDELPDEPWCPPDDP